jgi:hypothetical protein
MESSRKLYPLLILVAIAIRLVIAIIGGNRILTPWSGGGDMKAYVLLAQNLVSGQGYTYAHVPSTWRTPGYPLVIAGLMELFGVHFAVAVRCFQLIASVVIAYFCMRAALILFDEAAAKAALLSGLYFPTLLYFSGEFLSELLCAFFVALFLWMLAEDFVCPRWSSAALVGLSIGLGAMIRPNVAALGIVAVAAGYLARRATEHQRRQVILIPVVALLVFAPWIARNHSVFGRFLVTTKSGTDALVGTLNPESRNLPGWEDRMRERVGYVLPNELETNSPSRLALGSEVELNRRCWHAALQLIREMSWRQLLTWTSVKYLTYWLSTDQLLNPGKISRMNLALHASSVFLYWLLLFLACWGWWSLKCTQPKLASLLFAYAVLMTVLHTPFVMNSRIRAPLLDPLIAVLSGGGIAPAYMAVRRFWILA